MLVLLFIIHSIEFEKSIGNCARVRSEICCAGRLQVHTYSHSPLGPEKELREITIQVMYCTYHVTSRRVRATLLQWKSYKYSDTSANEDNSFRNHIR